MIYAFYWQKQQRWSPRGRPWPRGRPRGHILKSLALASSPRKLACPWLEDSSIFWNVKILWSAWKIFWKTFFSGDRLKNFCEDLFFFFLEIAWKIFVKTFFFFFGEHLRFVSLVLGLGLEHSCPWPRECLSSERLSLALALASDFFCVLGLGLGFFLCPRLHLWKTVLSGMSNLKQWLNKNLKVLHFLGHPVRR